MKFTRRYAITNFILNNQDKISVEWKEEYIDFPYTLDELSNFSDGELQCLFEDLISALKKSKAEFNLKQDGLPLYKN